MTLTWQQITNFANSGGGGSGGGSSTLAGDTDVSLSSPTNRQALVYNAGLGKWQNQTLAESDIANLTTDLSSKLTNSNNLSDLSSAATARLNLGLGNAALATIDTTSTDIASLGTQSAGTTGKVADAGHIHAMPQLDQVGNPTSSVNLNSHKIVNLSNGTIATDAATFGQIPTSLPPNGASGGDLSGSYPNPTVAKVNGISVSGTPSTNQSLVATGSTAAAWSSIVNSFNSRSGTVVPVSGDYTAAQVTNAADKSSSSTQAFTGAISTPDLIVSGLTGATANSRYVGATTSGAPTSGTFAVGDHVIDQTGVVWICTVAGTPGTWINTVAKNDFFYNVKYYGAKGDGVTDDRAAIQSAVAAANAAGGGIVFFPPGTYLIGNPIVALSNVTFFGCGTASVITSSVSNSGIASQSATLHDVVIDSLTFNGPVTVTVTQPTVGRGTPGNGLTYAIWMDGDLDPHATTPPTITNITIRNCYIKNCTQLPIWISGVRGRVLVTGNHFDNNKDLGFLWNQEVICTYNHVINTADNGISASRGNNKVVVANNTLENIAYSGIELGGFVGDIGPRDFVCTGNTLKNCGLAGIFLDEAPYYGTITGNTINQGYWYNATDQLSNTVGVGIWVRGAPHGTPSSPTDYATGLLISNNTIRQSARAGIYISSMKYSVVERNLILDTGTQFLSDGVTAIASNNTSQNIGILVDYTATDSTVIVRDNIVIDTRATPYCNYAVQPIPATSGLYIHNNTMLFCRNQPNTTQAIYSDSIGFVQGRQEVIPRWAATALTSVTMGSGVVRFVYLTARRTETITQVEFSSGNTAGTSATLARFGVYSVDSSGALTQLSQTSSDTTIFSVTQTDYARSLTSSISVVEGQIYAIAAIWVGTGTAPSVMAALCATPGLNALNPRLCSSLTGQADLSASYTAGSLTNTQSLPYCSLLQ